MLSNKIYFLQLHTSLIVHQTNPISVSSFKAFTRVKRKMIYLLFILLLQTELGNSLVCQNQYRFAKICEVRDYNDPYCNPLFPDTCPIIKRSRNQYRCPIKICTQVSLSYVNNFKIVRISFNYNVSKNILIKINISYNRYFKICLSHLWV